MEAGPVVLLGGSHNTDPQCQSRWAGLAGGTEREPCMPTTPLLSLLHPQLGGTCPGPSSSSSEKSCTPLQLVGTGHLVLQGWGQHHWQQGCHLSVLKMQLCDRNGQTDMEMECQCG